ncbi:MAG TPA: hypothetical protein VNO55_32980, partial [Polyangia bacterium]|nr:hypothetical protein [Polyangia bacterium]
GDTICLFSYGSGASAKLLQGVVQSGYRHVAAAAGLSGEFRDQRPDAEAGTPSRVSLSMADYHRLHGKDAIANRTPNVQPSVREPRNEFALVRFGNESGARKTDVGYRYYEYLR